MIIPTATELIANGSNRKLVCSLTAPSVMEISQTMTQATTARRLVTQNLYWAKCFTARKRSTLTIVRLKIVQIYSTTGGEMNGIFENSEYISQTWEFSKCLSLRPDSTGATVAPQRRSVMERLHRIDKPGRMNLIPLLYNAIMTAAFDTTHHTLKSIVNGENQLMMWKKLFWNETENPGMKHDWSTWSSMLLVDVWVSLTLYQLL